MGVVIYKDKTGRNSLKRVIAFIGLLVISAAFCLAAYKGRITDNMFLTYPLGLVILYAPQLAVTLLKIWKGQCVPEHEGSPGKDRRQDFGGDI